MRKIKYIVGNVSSTVLIALMFLMCLPVKTKAARIGGLDSAFDFTSFAIKSIGSTDAQRDSVIQPDVKFVVVCKSNTDAGGAAFDFSVVRYKPDGSLDTTFDRDGTVILTEREQEFNLPKLASDN